MFGRSEDKRVRDDGRRGDRRRREDYYHERRDQHTLEERIRQYHRGWKRGSDKAVPFPSLTGKTGQSFQRMTEGDLYHRRTRPTNYENRESSEGSVFADNNYRSEGTEGRSACEWKRDDKITSATKRSASERKEEPASRASRAREERYCKSDEAPVGLAAQKLSQRRKKAAEEKYLRWMKKKAYDITMTDSEFLSRMNDRYKMMLNGISAGSAKEFESITLGDDDDDDELAVIENATPSEPLHLFIPNRLLNRILAWRSEVPIGVPGEEEGEVANVEEAAQSAEEIVLEDD